MESHMGVTATFIWFPRPASTPAPASTVTVPFAAPLARPGQGNAGMSCSTEAVSAHTPRWKDRESFFNRKDCASTLNEL